MRADQMMTSADDLNRKGLFRAAGLGAMVLGVLYILITVVYVLVGALPKGAEESLKYLAGHTTAWWLILAFSVLTDLLFFPVALALYVALKDVNRNAVLAGAGLIAMFALLDLVVTWPNYSSLITLSKDYTAATSDVQREVFIAAATYATAVLASSLFAVYAILVPSVGILLIGLVMLKGKFNKITAYLGVASGILGIIAVVGPIFSSALGAAAILASVLTTVWVLFVGYRLYQLGQQ